MLQPNCWLFGWRRGGATGLLCQIGQIGLICQIGQPVAMDGGAHSYQVKEKLAYLNIQHSNKMHLFFTSLLDILPQGGIPRMRDAILDIRALA
jgi:hypothetical protein